MRAVLDGIFERELKRLDQISQERPLTLEELKALNTLTLSLKQYVEPPKEAVNPLEGLSSEDLLAIVKGVTDDGEAKPEPKVQRGGRNRKTNRKRPAVEKR
jgi:hypothetical protein